MNTIAELTSKRILDLCQENNITINKLSTISGLTQSTVNSIINGKSQNPQLKTIFKICNGLNISVSEFFNCDYFKNIYFDD